MISMAERLISVDISDFEMFTDKQSLSFSYQDQNTRNALDFS